MSNEFLDFCAKNGIHRQHTTRNRPQQNGVAERANRTIEEAIISMLNEAGLPASFWAEALSAFVHVWNRTSTSAVAHKTPYETFYGVKPDVSRLRVWGCTAYVHVQKDKRALGNLGSHMEKCVFIGYPSGYKGWKFYNPQTKKVVISETAVFDERYFLHKKDSSPSFKPGDLSEPLPTPPPTPPPMVTLPLLQHDPDDDSNGDDDMQDHGGDGVGPDPPPPHPPQPTYPPSPPTYLPGDYPHWISSLSPEPPSSPQECLSPPSPDGEHPPIPGPSTPIPPLLQQRQPRHPADPNWREYTYKVKDSEQFRDKPKRSKGSTPGPQPSTSPDDSPQSPSSALPPQLSTPPAEIDLSPPPVPATHLPESSPSPAPSSPAVWQPRDPTPILSSDEDDQESSDSYDPDDTFYSTAHAHLSSITEPQTFKQSQKLPESSQWKKACLEELEAHKLNGTWKVVQLPPGKKLVGSRWHFKVKRNTDGSVERFKARLVAKGYSQRPGFDFTETFAPTARYSAVRAILALAALEDMEIHSLDISNAYLNGVLEEEIYMELPEGFEDLGKPGDVLLLLKACYGLKQAARVWARTLASTLNKMGFVQIKSDPSVYVLVRDNLRIIIPVFVDDMTLISKSKAAHPSLHQGALHLLQTQGPWTHNPTSWHQD